jgi:hypothetical protein
MIFFPDTHEVLWLEAGYLVRSWMDKTERRLLCQLPGDANATELENGNGTGAALREVKMVLGVGKAEWYCRLW